MSFHTKKNLVVANAVVLKLCIALLNHCIFGRNLVFCEKSYENCKNALTQKCYSLTTTGLVPTKFFVEVKDKYE
jgi:hypothetical protein